MGIEIRSRAEVGVEIPGAERNDGIAASAVLGLILRFECERDDRRDEEDVEVGCSVGERKEGDDVVV